MRTTEVVPTLLYSAWADRFMTKKREKEQISETVEKRENDLTFTPSAQPMMHQYRFIDHRSYCFMVTYSHHIPARY